MALTGGHVAGLGDHVGDHNLIDAALDARVQLPATTDKIIHVSARGSDSNDGLTPKTALLTLGAAVAALGGPGIIEIGQGVIDFSSQLNLASSIGVWLRGRGGTSAGATPASVIRYTGTGSTAAINARNSTGFRMTGLMMLNTSASFTGTMVDLTALTGSNTVFSTVERCYFGGSSGIRSARALGLAMSHTMKIADCQFIGLDTGIVGRDINTQDANNIAIEGCYFRDNVTAHIKNPGDSWVLRSPTFEALYSGAAGAVLCDSGFSVNAFSVENGWAGDVIASAGGAQYTLSGNSIDIRSFIGGQTGSTGVKLNGTCSGVRIESRFDGPTTGIDVSTATLSGYDFRLSTFTGVGTTVTSGILHD